VLNWRPRFLNQIKSSIFFHVQLDKILAVNITLRENGDQKLKINAKMPPSRILRIMQRTHSVHVSSTVPGYYGFTFPGRSLSNEQSIWQHLDSMVLWKMPGFQG